MMDGKGAYEAEFRDHDTQLQILHKLLLENRPLSYTALGELLEVTPSVAAGNCGELRAKGWIRRVELEGRSHMELTVPGTDVARRLFPGE